MIRLWPRSSPEGHREVSEEEARRVELEGRRPKPPNPFSVGYDQGVEHAVGRSRPGLEQSLRFFEGRRVDCLRRGSESGARLAEGFIAALRAQLRDLPEPQGPTGVVGPDGEWLGGPTGAVPIFEQVEAKGRPDEVVGGYGHLGVTGAQGPNFRDGEWYAFRVYRLAHDEDIAEEFFAVATADPTTGFLELREIPDPWLCRVCGKRYQDGVHTELGVSDPAAHDYAARGAPATEES